MRRGSSTPPRAGRPHGGSACALRQLRGLLRDRARRAVRRARPHRRRPAGGGGHHAGRLSPRVGAVAPRAVAREPDRVPVSDRDELVPDAPPSCAGREPSRVPAPPRNEGAGRGRGAARDRSRPRGYAAAATCRGGPDRAPRVQLQRGGEGPGRQARDHARKLAQQGRDTLRRTLGVPRGGPSRERTADDARAAPQGARSGPRRVRPARPPAPAEGTDPAPGCDRRRAHGLGGGHLGLRAGRVVLPGGPRGPHDRPVDGGSARGQPGRPWSGAPRSP